MEVGEAPSWPKTPMQDRSFWPDSHIIELIAARELVLLGFRALGVRFRVLLAS